MPSSNKTPNLQLNQWEGNEYVKRQDFVDDNKKIDNAYKELNRKFENIQLVDTKVELTDPDNLFELGEDANINQALMILAKKTEKIDVDLNGQRLKAINIHNRLDNVIGGE